MKTYKQYFAESVISPDTDLINQINNSISHFISDNLGNRWSDIDTLCSDFNDHLEYELNRNFGYHHNISVKDSDNINNINVRTYRTAQDYGPNITHYEIEYPRSFMMAVLQGNEKLAMQYYNELVNKIISNIIRNAQKDAFMRSKVGSHEYDGFRINTSTSKYNDEIEKTKSYHNLMAFAHVCAIELLDYYDRNESPIMNELNSAYRIIRKINRNYSSYQENPPFKNINQLSQNEILQELAEHGSESDIKLFFKYITQYLDEFGLYNYRQYSHFNVKDMANRYIDFLIKEYKSARLPNPYGQIKYELDNEMPNMINAVQGKLHQPLFYGFDTINQDPAFQRLINGGTVDDVKQLFKYMIEYLNQMA